MVTYEPKDQYRISKLFKSTVPRPTKKYVFHRWIDYEGLQPVPQEYAMVNDYITQTFDILKKGSWYYTCTPKGKKLHTFSTSNVGEVLTATGDTFTSRRGSWIYTWDKNGKKLSTRPANQ